jgi:hypothetical protein
MQSKFGSKASSTNSNSHDNPKLMLHTNQSCNSQPCLHSTGCSICLPISVGLS